MGADSRGGLTTCRIGTPGPSGRATRRCGSPRQPLPCPWRRIAPQISAKPSRAVRASANGSRRSPCPSRQRQAHDLPNSLNHQSDRLRPSSARAYSAVAQASPGRTGTMGRASRAGTGASDAGTSVTPAPSVREYAPVPSSAHPFAGVAIAGVHNTVQARRLPDHDSPSRSRSWERSVRWPMRGSRPRKSMVSSGRTAQRSRSSSGSGRAPGGPAPWGSPRCSMLPR